MASGGVVSVITWINLDVLPNVDRLTLGGNVAEVVIAMGRCVFARSRRKVLENVRHAMCECVCVHTRTHTCVYFYEH